MPADPSYKRLVETFKPPLIGDRIPNYFGMWDQQLSAYFWNPTLAMVATGRYDDMPKTERDSDMSPQEFESPSCGRLPRCQTPTADCPFYRAGVS
jgi:hypothetical protein